MKRSASGFTVVELLITLIIMAILLTLGVAGFRGMQANAADAEKKSDVESLARALENYYNRGNPKQFSYETKGTYPGANEINFMTAASNCTWIGDANVYLPSVCGPNYLLEALPGVSTAVFTSPGEEQANWSTTWVMAERNPIEIMTDGIQTRIDDDMYVYKAMSRDTYQTCYHACPRYAIIYKKETTGETVIIRSRHNS